MSSSADLFVVCKQCGSEVSPYITECPYCGHRLRRRAPKLPRENVPGRTPRGLARLPWLHGRRPAHAGARRSLSRWAEGSRAASVPYVTMALVVTGCAVWVLLRAGFVHVDKFFFTHAIILGPLHGDWWELFTSQFAYFNGLYAFDALVTIALFGWLLERRHGPALVLALFLGAGAAGALAALAVYSDPIVIGGNAGAFALLAAWAAPDLEAARTGSYYEGDLLGTGAFAAVLLAVPFALRSPEASWLAGVTGGAIGLLVGLGLHRAQPGEI